MKLPTELLLSIFSRLDNPLDISNCSRVCKHWNLVCRDGRLWNNLCLLYNVPSYTGDNYKERERERFTSMSGVVTKYTNPEFIYKLWFREFHQNHPLLVELYPQCKDLCSRLYFYLRQNSPSTFLSLQSGQMDISKLFKKMMERTSSSFIITKDLLMFILFYHFIDGQKARMPHVDNGLFGTYTCYNQLVSLCMLPYQYLQVERVYSFELLVFAVCPRSGKFLSIVLGIDDDDKEGGKELNYDYDYTQSQLYHSQRVKSVLDKESVLHHVVEVDERSRQFYDHGGFTEFLCNYVDALEGGVYELEGQHKSISMFKNAKMLNTDTFTSWKVSNGVMVSCSSLLSMETMTHGGAWTYRIQIELVPDTLVATIKRRRCQLLKRHWLVCYKSGYQEHVRGEGVVGVCPILSLDGNPPQNGGVDVNHVNSNRNNPDNVTGPKFTYCSMCTGRTYSESNNDDNGGGGGANEVDQQQQQAYMFDPAVSMEGEFEFKDFDTGEMFLVDIPKFMLPQAKVFTDEKYPYHPVQPEFQWEYK